MWPAAEIQFQKVLLREEMGLEITILKLDIDGLVGGNLRKRLWYFGQNNQGFSLLGSHLPCSKLNKFLFGD